MLKNNSSQESQHGSKLLVVISRNKIRKKKNVKKFVCKKGGKLQILRDNSHHMLRYHQEKDGMESFRNSRNFYGTIINEKLKVKSFNDFLDDCKEVHVKRRSMLSVAETEEEDQKQDNVVE